MVVRVRRRTLLVGLAAGLTGATATAGTALATPSAAGILGSTRTSTLLPRAPIAYCPPAGTPPPVTGPVVRSDHVFGRAGRVLNTRVWRPTGRGPYPIVVFSHGLLSQPDDYAELLTGWARAGFVVAAPLYPHTSLGAADFNTYDIVNQPADASAVLTQLLDLRLGADPDRVVAAGHSAGGITTVGLFSAHRDARLKAGVVFAGTDFLGTPFAGAPAAMLFVQGRLDRTVSWEAAHTVYRAVPWSRAMLTITDGDHQSGTAETGATTAFLRWSLYGGGPRLAAPAGATLTDELHIPPVAGSSPARPTVWHSRRTSISCWPENVL